MAHTHPEQSQPSWVVKKAHVLVKPSQVEPRHPLRHPPSVHGKKQMGSTARSRGASGFIDHCIQSREQRVQGRVTFACECEGGVVCHPKLFIKFSVI